MGRKNPWNDEPPPTWWELSADTADPEQCRWFAIFLRRVLQNQARGGANDLGLYDASEVRELHEWLVSRWGLVFSFDLAPSVSEGSSIGSWRFRPDWHVAAVRMALKAIRAPQQRAADASRCATLDDWL
ncbi:MAG: hypothetical protein HY275_03595 [Gemmatimonadetes bacterium]|nr:hypothetical protein [Gemmatimonadota bacterium]